MQGDWAVVEVRLGGERHPYRFIVDSGAGATVIDQALASRFTANSSGSSNVQGASGDQASFQNAKLGQLNVAGLSFRNLEVVVTDMRQFSGARISTTTAYWAAMSYLVTRTCSTFRAGA
jgi:predicted aspartyl protease